MFPILILYENEEFKEPIEYIFGFIMSILGLGYRIIQAEEMNSEKEANFPLIISYGKERPRIDVKNQIHIYESDYFGENYLNVKSLPGLPLERYNGLPIIYRGINRIENCVRMSNNSIEIDIDIIASSFFMVTRYEEVVLKDRDKHGRFTATDSLAFKENFIDRPIVNEYIEMLWSWINNTHLGFKRKNRWADKDFAVCLTHDVDEIRRYRRPPLFSIIRSIRQRNAKKAISIFCDYLKTKACLKQDIYHDTFDYIINLEKQYGFRSSFYFMVSGERYSIGDPWLKGLMEKLKNNKFEVGIHPSGNAFNKPDVLKSEKHKLEKVAGKEIIGGRQHYLRWQVPESWSVWEVAGLQYDTTLGFADYPGFRSGICCPFKPFDIFGNRIINLWEIPLVVMDGTLIDYRKLSSDDGFKILLKLLDTVERYGGVFVLLWHNSNMTELFSPQWKKCFEKFYKLIAERNCLVSSMKNALNQWWDLKSE